MNKKIIVNKNTPKRINFKISKKRNRNLSNNKVSLKYLLSNNSDSKKKLSLLLSRDVNNSKVNNKLIVNKSDSRNEDKIIKQNIDDKHISNIDNQLKINSDNSHLERIDSSENKWTPNNKIKKEIQSVIKNSISENVIKSPQITPKDKSNMVISEKINNSPENKSINLGGGERNMNKSVSSKRTSSNNEIVNKKKNISNGRNKKEKIISLDIKKRSIRQNQKRTKFINSVNKLSHSNIKKILIKNNLIKTDSKAPKELMKNILVNSIDLGVNLF